MQDLLERTRRLEEINVMRVRAAAVTDHDAIKGARRPRGAELIGPREHVGAERIAMNEGPFSSPPHELGQEGRGRDDAIAREQSFQVSLHAPRVQLLIRRAQSTHRPMRPDQFGFEDQIIGIENDWLAQALRRRDQARECRRHHQPIEHDHVEMERRLGIHFRFVPPIHHGRFVSQNPQLFAQMRAAIASRHRNRAAVRDEKAERRDAFFWFDSDAAGGRAAKGCAQEI